MVGVVVWWGGGAEEVRGFLIEERDFGAAELVELSVEVGADEVVGEDEGHAVVDGADGVRGFGGEHGEAGSVLAVFPDAA